MTNTNVNFSQFTTDESWSSTRYPNSSGYSGGSLSSISPLSTTSTINQLLNSQNLNHITTPTMPMFQSSFNFSGLPPRGPSSSVWTSPNSIGVSDPTLPLEAQQSNTPDVAIWSASKAVEQFLMDENEENNKEGSNVHPMGVMRSEIATGRNQETGFPVATGAIEMPSGGLESSKPPLAPGVYVFAPTYGTTMASACEINKSRRENRVLGVVSPKKFKKLLANRESAAHSKMKRVAYEAQLEAEFANVQAAHANLITKYNQLQKKSERDRIALFNENRQLKIRFDGMEKQEQLHQEQAELHRTLIQQLKARIDELNINQLH